MLKKIPKLAKMLALVHLIYASVFFISMSAYGLVWPNKEGNIPFIFIIMLMILSIIDYPLARLFEYWSVIKSSSYLFFILLILFGTLMWFAVGLLLNKLVNRFRKAKHSTLEESKSP